MFVDHIFEITGTLYVSENALSCKIGSSVEVVS